MGSKTSYSVVILVSLFNSMPFFFLSKIQRTVLNLYKCDKSLRSSVLLPLKFHWT
jgi:hypothetical protein